ncbi:MAG TPA: TA system VapC family ribonuclease toxin [Verrucomicrobiales bacterium]|nr:TA system VapC family ribonuclease toxin [Verrucomicrobiales bacterium]
MSHLLDVNLLLACAWSTHPRHTEANLWLDAAAEFATAPITQMGFMRVSMSPAYQASFADALAGLQAILKLPSHRFLTDAVEANFLPPVTRGGDVTDAHLVKLAAGHGFKLATLDNTLCSKSWATGIAEDPL